MTIEIYRSALCALPAETVEFAGTVQEFWNACRPDLKDVSPAPIAMFDLHGREIPASEWATTLADGCSARIVQEGFDPISWAYIISAALVAVSLVMQPSAQSYKQQAQGKSLATAEAVANIAKPNQVVPELFGTYLRYPDYLVPPHRYFADARTQYMETLLCVGPGEYDISKVCIGNTEFAALEGTEYRVYGPEEDVGSEGLHENWYSAKEVGSTSAGTAGLELSSETTVAALPTSTSYVFNGNTISNDTGWPAAWGSNTQLQIKLRLPYAVTRVGSTSTYSEFEGKFSHIQPLGIGGDLFCNIDGQTVQLRVNTLSPSSSGNYKVTFLYKDSDSVYLPWNSPAAGLKNAAFYSESVLFSFMGDVSNIATFSSISGWFGFPNVTLLSAEVEFSIANNVLYGDWTGPFFAMPVGETATRFQYDLFFPQGLNELDKGDVIGRSVTVQVQYRKDGGAWATMQKTYSNATVDQIGFTENLTLPAGRYEFRHRRISAASSSTSINDKVQLYGLRSLLETPTNYSGWTTIGVRIKGLGKIGSSSENQINVLATRKLPTIGNFAATPTRDISAAVLHIAKSIGYDHIDMGALQALHNVWAARGETLDHVFDATTVRAALGTAMRAGMGEMTIVDGLVTPVREGIRTQVTKAYSKQNTLGDIRRTFKTPRPDDNDGVQVEYVSAADNYVIKTVNCMLPVSDGIKLEKLKLEGVTDVTRAWRTGMRRAREMSYIRWAYSFDTEMDAFCSNYKDFVALIPDIPEYGRSAIAMGARRVPEGIEIAITEPVTDGAEIVAWRDANGGLSGPFNITRISRNVLIAAAPTGVKLPNTSSKMEPAHIYMGTVLQWSMPALIERIQPSEKTASVQAVNYDARKYADDDNFPTGV